MTFEHQLTFAIKLLSGSVQLAVHVVAVQDAAVLIGVFTPTLQTVVYIETLQGAGGGGHRREIIIIIII